MKLPMTARRASPRGAPAGFAGLAAGALLLCACATPTPPGGPLDADQVRHLDTLALSTRDLGIEISRRRGDVRLVNAYAMTFGAQVESPLTRTHGPVTLPILIGERRATAALCSGITASFTDLSTARRLELVPIGHPLKQMPIQGPFTDLSLYMALTRTARFGSLHIYNVPIGILDDQRGLPALWWLSPGEADVVLGDDFLRAFALVTFDFPGRRFLASHSETYKPNVERMVCAVSMKRGFSGPVVDVRINDEGPFPVLIDTSLDVGIWLPTHMAEMLKVRPADDVAGGPLPYRPAGTAQVSLGEFTLNQLPAVVTVSDRADNDLPYAVLGAGGLREHVLTLDFKSRKVYVERP